jgi:hypothetical protein
VAKSATFFIFQKIVLYCEKFKALILGYFPVCWEMKNNFEKIERGVRVP